MSQLLPGRIGQHWHQQMALGGRGCSSGSIFRHSKMVMRLALGRQCSSIMPCLRSAPSFWRDLSCRGSSLWTTCAPFLTLLAETFGQPRGGSRHCSRSRQAPSVACTSIRRGHTSTRCCSLEESAGECSDRRSLRGSIRKATVCFSMQTPSTPTWNGSLSSALHGLQRRFSVPVIRFLFRRARLIRSSTRRPRWPSLQTTWQEWAWTRH
mmetsp:Transcript_43724/g.126281  ORF Transcript_43724/g.126281 Transcript_43724/m.126281 type:complete len:209 (-) Transcript_43724:334-960(-)